MSKGRHQQSPQIVGRANARPGEMAVPVIKQAIPKPDGSTHVAISIDLSQVPVPDRRYVASTAGVVYDGVSVQVAFGQKRLSGDNLRSLIVVVLSPDAVRRFLDSCEKFTPILAAFMKKQAVKPVPLLEEIDEPDQTVAMTSNIISLAHAGLEASIDFYHASAGSIHALNQRDILGVDPIIRVDLPVGLAASLLAKLDSLKGTLPPEVE